MTVQITATHNHVIARACHLFMHWKRVTFPVSCMVVQDNYNHRENSRIIIIIGPTVIITLPYTEAAEAAGGWGGEISMATLRRK